jgi:putative nucleotidyltransferase with HDIG domain
MTFRVRILICLVVAGGTATFCSILGHPGKEWIHFFVYLVAILLSSGMKVAMPESEGTMSVNFPFILLGILQLSPLQAVVLATCSVLAQCRIQVIKPFTLLQMLFNVANTATATALAWHTYAASMRLNVGMAPALAIAATVYFFANTIPVALIIAWDSCKPPLALWRESFLWYLPFYLVGALLAAIANLIGLWFGWMTSLLLIPVVYTIYRGYCGHVAIVCDRERHIEETEALHLRTIEALAMAIEAKDKGTHSHLMRVRVYVSEMGRIMGLDQSIMQALLTASFLHDIGKLAVPEHIINKPGKLSREEFEKMKIHPGVGADILERVRFPYPVVPIVRSHHEAWDGSGYPDGLKGEEIPIGARILAVVDCFDALASDRPYRKAMSLDEAMALVKSRASIQFDPDIVRLIGENYLVWEKKARQQIEEVAPLKTDLLIHRGAAPGAGLAPEQREPGAKNQQESTQGEVTNSVSTKLHDASLNLIAAASLEAKAVFELSQTLGSSLSAHETSAMMSRRLKPLVPFDCFAVYLKCDASLQVQFIDGPCSRGFSLQRIPVGEGLSGWVAQNGRSIVNGNPTVEPNYLSVTSLLTGASSALSIPLFDLKGTIFGVLTLYSAATVAFSREHLLILQAIESKFSLSLQNALRSTIAEADDTINHLTQLPNMRHFLHQINPEFKLGAADRRRYLQKQIFRETSPESELQPGIGSLAKP